MQGSEIDDPMPLASEVDAHRIQELRERLERARRRKDKLEICHELSRLTFYTDPEQALEYARQALRLAKNIDDELEVGRSSAQIGQIFHYMRRYEDAEPFLQDALAIYERHKETEARCSSMLRLLAQIQQSHGDFMLTISLLQRALEFARLSGSPYEICQVLASLAHMVMELGDYTWALDMLEEVVRLATGASDHHGLALAYNGISSIQQKMGNHQEALQVLHQALEIIQSLGDRTAEAVLLGNIGTAHRMCAQEEKSLDYNRQAMAMFEEMGWDQNVVMCLYDIAACCFQLERWEEGFAHMNHGIDIARRIGAKVELSACMMALGHNLMEFGDLDRALDTLLAAGELSDELGLREQFGSIHGLLADLYEKQGEFEPALRSVRLHMEIRQEQDLLNVRQRLSAMELRMNVERAEKEKEIFRLKAEQLHRDMEQKNRELAAMALQQVQTGEIIARLQKMVRSMAPGSGGTGKDMAKVLMQHIGQLGASDSQWKTFEERFTPVHPEFMRKLTTICSDLTPTEMKICTLLRINMSSKEIASFLGTSVRTVEGHRRFIRRRLNLAPEGSLSMFLATL